MSEIDRIRWSCRRGLLELDLVLQRFLNDHYLSLTVEQKKTFTRLLGCQTTIYWIWQWNVRTQTTRHLGSW
jgi:antitoxin CptB